jgi:UDP-N-acetylmuramate--alanine ligase
MQTVGHAGGVEVIDDFAHNPDKIAAALAAAHLREKRLLVVFQPHGYGPTRFLRDDLIAAFAAGLAERDILWLPEIYYAGGSVTRDISSADIAAGVTARGRDARFVPDRPEIAAQVVTGARSGDLVMVMGARDPSLTDFCGDILRGLDRSAREARPG